MKKIYKILIISLVLSLLLIFPPQSMLYSKDYQYQNSGMASFISYWIGTPYRYGGTTKKGIDCSAFSRVFYMEFFGKTIPRTAREQFRALEKITKECLQAGDLIFFRSKGSPSGWHVGIYLWGNNFIHAANRKMGVVISNLERPEYSKKILGYRR